MHRPVFLSTGGAEAGSSSLFERTGSTGADRSGHLERTSGAEAGSSSPFERTAAPKQAGAGHFERQVAQVQHLHVFLHVFEP